MKKYLLFLLVIFLLIGCESNNSPKEYDPILPNDWTYTEEEDFFIEVSYLFEDNYDSDDSEILGVTIEVIIFPKDYSESMENVKATLMYPEIIQDAIYVHTRTVCASSPEGERVDIGKVYNTTGLAYSCGTLFERDLLLRNLEGFLNSNPKMILSYNDEEVEFYFPHELIRVNDMTSDRVLNR